MALEASHIRIALAVEGKLSITDRGAYLCGAIYPDSRYVTKIERLLTHPTDYKNDPMFMREDFYKGWLVHLLTDDIQYKAMQEALPKVCEGVDGQGSDVWMRRTAIKIIQDMSDAKFFDINSTFSYFDQVFTPNGEDVDLMKQYNKLYVDMYQFIDKLSLESYAAFWRAFDVDDSTVARMIEQTKTYLLDRGITAKAEGLYETIVGKLAYELVKVS
ncbi:MAG TPA: hypothetical protein VLG69_03995 [Candidatus Andersenbacteria bacterium]|nr:hypothetical protein [Candidatus Andersenbacteria bacterium]